MTLPALIYALIKMVKSRGVFLIGATLLAASVVLMLRFDKSYVFSDRQLRYPTAETEGGGGVLSFSLMGGRVETASMSPAALMIFPTATASKVTWTVIPERDSELEPMVFSLSYWEQTGNALSSLINFQCWANSMNISKVVEPSIVSVMSYSTFQLRTDSKAMKFEDLFDISHWNAMSTNLNLSSLVPVKYFLRRAVKDVVYVHIKYRWTSIKCNPPGRKWKDFLERSGFRVVKSVCIDFTRSHVMTEAAFKDLIFQGLDHEVTLMFNEWRGIRNSSRIALKGRICRKVMGSLVRVETSDSKPSTISYVPYISTTAIAASMRINQFIDRFIREHLSSDEYVAIMLRTEKISSGLSSNSSCANDILYDWKNLTGDNNITKTLLFSDVGKHGSMGWYSSAASRFSQHLRNAVHVHLTGDKMNSILEGFTHSKNSVQVALLHQQLVIRATCVIIVGGGTFQMQTLNQYAHLHRNHMCYSLRSGACKSCHITRVNGYGLSS